MNSIKIEGNIDIFSVQSEELFEGEILQSREVFIHGDSEGLKSLAQLLIKLLEFN